MSRTIWTNGCFDILHIGHIKLFEYARSLGDKLIVGIDGDERVKLLKGINRPINNEQNRKMLLESIKYIDGVYIFNSDDQLRGLIKNNDVHTIVVGDDYKTKIVIGSEYSTETIFFPKISSVSTSNILLSMKANICPI
jgi:D-beta-D-heptose 7-phosphate kinase/D-beta-D-heptose 1-phosphate adenosyltransferase